MVMRLVVREMRCRPRVQRRSLAKAARGQRLHRQVYVCQGKDTGEKAQKVKGEQEGGMWVGLMGTCFGAWTRET
jgi:hypothetical protein